MSQRTVKGTCCTSIKIVFKTSFPLSLSAILRREKNEGPGKGSEPASSCMSGQLWFLPSVNHISRQCDSIPPFSMSIQDSILIHCHLMEESNAPSRVPEHTFRMSAALRRAKRRQHRTDGTFDARQEATRQAALTRIEPLTREAAERHVLRRSKIASLFDDGQLDFLQGPLPKAEEVVSASRAQVNR